MDLTVQQIDHLIAQATLVPQRDRGVGWQAMVDSLLEQRERATPHPPVVVGARTTRVIQPTEVR